MEHTPQCIAGYACWCDDETPIITHEEIRTFIIDNYSHEWAEVDEYDCGAQWRNYRNRFWHTVELYAEQGFEFENVNIYGRTPEEEEAYLNERPFLKSLYL